MKGLLFFLVLLVIGMVVWSFPQATEGFQGGDVENPEPAIPLISPRYQTLTKGTVQPFAPPSTSLLAPPPGQSASVNTQPATDPAMQKSTVGRIQSVYESMAGFFMNEAAGLKTIGDPSVQLPLSTARSDMRRLKDELNTMKKNPGLESSLTSEDLDGIDANLGYLQKKWRQSTNAMSGGPMPPEGFQSGAAAGGWYGYFFGGRQEGFQTSGGSGSGSGAPMSDLSLADLQNLSLRLNIEVVRLQSSGTTDLNTQSRINNLTKIKQAIDDLIAKITSGAMKLSAIPLMKSDIANFLPAMENPNSALPNIVSLLGGNTFLNSLFSSYSGGDISGAHVAEQLMTNYGNTFLNNLSWDVSLKYKGKAEQDIAKNYANGMADARRVSASSAGSPAAFDASGNEAYRGMFHSVIQNMTGMMPDSVSVGIGGAGYGTAADSTGMVSAASNPAAAAGPLDWHQRSTDICNQIRARGMDPNDFGCLADANAEGHANFSWRGYTRMVCTRLATVYDPSIPELCGCPPQTWAGWRS